MIFTKIQAMANSCAVSTLFQRRTLRRPSAAWRSLALALFLAVASAGHSAGLKIVTSFYPIYLATLNVAGNIAGVEIINLTGPQTGCLHDYQLTPRDLLTLGKADILIANGAGLETFLAKAIQQAPHLKLIEASQGIPLISMGGAANPHVWVNIANHMKQVENIATNLCRLDPEHAGSYRQNAEGYLARLESLRSAMRAGLENISERNIVTFHEAFAYFAQEFGLNVVAVIEHEPGSAPKARELAEVITLIKRSSVKAIFTEPQYPAEAAELIARETGAIVHCLDPVVTGPPRADAYLTIMQANLRTLQQALGKTH